MLKFKWKSSVCMGQIVPLVRVLAFSFMPAIYLLICKKILSFSNSTCDILIIELNVYRPLNCTLDKFKDVLDNVSKCLHLINTLTLRTILMGDLNIHQIDSPTNTTNSTIYS